MCGIIAIVSPDRPQEAALLRQLASGSLGHRGPDGVGASSLGHAAAGHARLAIVDVAGGRQPMQAEDGRCLLVCNGEIYNHRVLRERLGSGRRFQSESDSEIVLHLYQELGARCAPELDGMFAFFVSDGERFAAARDPFGIKPLYVGRGASGEIWLASELKALIDRCERFAALPPGSWMTEEGEVRWFRPGWAEPAPDREHSSPAEIAARLERSVVKRLMSDVPMGIFLSGGLDSSIVAALARPHLGRTKSFAVGLSDAPDLAAARAVAKALGTEHYECSYSLEDVERALESIIYHLESYDLELVRSAVPCYFLSQLAAEHVKVVLTGEGADELFAGYAFFSRMRDGAALHDECARLLLGLHAMNLQRVDRMTMAHGLEGRVPFLDVEFVDYAMSIDPELKLHGAGRQEKHLLREAVAGLLPEEIVRRSKLEFSHGSGAPRLLESLAERRVSDRDLGNAAARFPIDTPNSKEELLYRLIFEDVLPGKAARETVQRWRPSFESPRRASPGEN